MAGAAVIAHALGGKRNGRGWKCRCPAHEDHDPSLDVVEENGLVLFICRAGCTQEAVSDALTARGLWGGRGNGHDPGADLLPDRHPTLGHPDHRYEYTDTAGRTLGYVYRWDARAGRKKEIRPLFHVAGRWEWKACPAPRPLYGLAELAAFPMKPVLIVEGEKAAHGARDHVETHVVMTWPGGTGGIAHVDLAPLAGRSIVLWADNDEPGRAAMRELADRLTAARSIKGVKVPRDLPDGWDLGDAKPAALDPIALIGGAVDVRLDRLAGLKLVNAANLVATHFKEPRWAVHGLVPEGLALLAGKPKTGKSWAALDFAIAVASGATALGTIACEAGPVLYLALEDTQRRLHGRLKAVLQGAPAPPTLDIAVTWRRADEGGIDDIRAWLSVHPDARLVIVDTFAKVRGKPTRDSGVYQDDYTAVTAFKALADEFTVPHILIHHLNKAGNDDPIMAVSGTAGITGSADTILVLKRNPGETFGTLYVRGRDVIEAELAVQFDNDTGKWLHTGAAGEARKSEQRRVILKLLADNVDPMSPIDIATLLGKPRPAIRQLLVKLHRSGDVSQLPNGKYFVTTRP